MYLGVYLTSAVVVCFGVITYWCPACVLIGILTVLGVILSVIGVVWVHILLSSPHKTGVGIEHAYKEQEMFRNRLMVNFKICVLVLFIILCFYRKILIIITRRKVLRIIYPLFLEELLIVYSNSLWIML